MQFIDEATITVHAGRGGDGCVSFFREKYNPKGGPDGGDGGNGGSIYIQALRHINTLLDYRYQKRHAADNGQPGGGNCRTGPSGRDKTLYVPVGTSIINAATNEVFADLTDHEQIFCVAKGGRHGVGNFRFKSSTNRAPRRSIPGQPGETFELKLELKLIADVGLLGLPNAGKSTLLRAVSSAHPKVADYPFTTLEPHLGVVRVDKGASFVVADIPGLIEGASQGSGLGIQFLRHLERSKLLLHVIDLEPADGSNAIDNMQTIHNELIHYSQTLAEKPQWLILNKSDLVTEDEFKLVRNEIINKLGWPVIIYPISAITGNGISNLTTAIYHYLQKQNQ
jgi:GTP-binding protein